MAQDPYKYFRPEAHEILEKFSRGILDLEKGERGAATIQHLLRLAHTLKGAARVVKQSEIANRAHAIEDALLPQRHSALQIGREQIDTVLQHVDAINSQLILLAPAAEPAASVSGKAPTEDAPRTIRADLAEADAILDSVVETHALMNGLRLSTQSVQQVARLVDLLVSQSTIFASDAHDRQASTRNNRRLAIAEELRRKMGGVERTLGSLVDQMDRELRQLREAAERLRLVPAGNLFTTLERMARDTGRALSKEVGFKGTGGDIRLDARVLDTVQGALVQIIRNAVAHGIEPNDERTRAGKPLVGVVSLVISRRDRRIVFSCSDDGRGVDLEAVRRVALQRGLVESAATELGSDDIVRVLLRGGISTSKTVTEESGRGIGLDVVRESVEQLGGEVGFRSTPGIGTTFEIIIPPSLSSMDALIVQAGGNAGTIAIPLHAVRATRRLEANEITLTTLSASIRHEEEAIAFVPLFSALSGTAWSAEGNWAVVVLAGADGLAGIGVERLLGTAKIVVRPLPRHLLTSPIVVAASLDTDGNPQLIADPDGLVAAARRGCATELDARPAKATVLVVDDSLTTRMLEQSILESAGYDVDVAASGEEGIDRIRSKRYALILVDVEMPGMDGFTFIEHIRSDSKSRDIPAVVVTSLAEPQYRQRCRDVGAQGYIVKSEFNQAELLSMIKPMMAA
jgi:two-component system, chemotaxis family, sensor kinase CheA